MRVVYTCVEMLETPPVARVLYAQSFQASLSGIYIDEAHVVHESHSWRPAYTQLNILRKILGTEAPLIGISATFPKRYRHSLVVHVGMLPQYHLINLGNYRPELSVIVKHMEHETSSFLDLMFVLPSQSAVDTIKSTIIYFDDLELLTKMFWWFHQRLGALGLPLTLIDILHAGLSDAHQKKCTDDFIAGKSKILLGSDKIGAGMDFPSVGLVVQYRVRDLTLVKWEQRRGRGARRDGMTALGIMLVEKSMTGSDGKLSVTSPGTEDPALLAYIHTKLTCHIEISDVWLENPPRNPGSFPPLKCQICSNCNPDLRIARELVWIMEPAHGNGQSAADAGNVSRTPSHALTARKKKQIICKLKDWRVKIWRDEWEDDWPSYGPQSLISDKDLDIIAQRAHSIHGYDDIYSLTQILHIDELFTPLLSALKRILSEVRPELLANNSSSLPASTVSSASIIDSHPPANHERPLTFTSVQWAAPENSETMQVQTGPVLRHKRTIDNLSGNFSN